MQATGSDLMSITKSGESKADGPDLFMKYQMEIRTKYGHQKPDYKPNYKFRELDKALKLKSRNSATLRQTGSVLNLVWKERGPSNVPGRTRGLLIDPRDPNKNTWFAGTAGGGIWKTTNAGANWINKTPDLPNLSTTVLAISNSNPEVIYAGTGEGFFNSGSIDGDGIFKSIDGGETWDQLLSTAGDLDFININEIIVDPSDTNVLLICANGSPPVSSGIMKSVDGGDNWTKVYSANSRVQDLVFDPNDFNIQYAGVNTFGVIKSIDGGDTWQKFSSGLSANGRIELAISPVVSSRIFAAVEGELSDAEGSSDLFISDDSGGSWSLVKEENEGVNVDWMDSQGWYNNSIIAHPYDLDLLYVGGIDLHMFKIKAGTAVGPDQIKNISELGTDAFLAFESSTLSHLNGGFGTGVDWFDNWDGFPIEIAGSDYTSIEIRFGSGRRQMAHRFTVPSNAGTNNDGGAGIGPLEHFYQDYVQVPFEVWDIDNNIQLMVSFRDQEGDGKFELVQRIQADPTIGREYIFVNAVTYNPNNPDSKIAATAGHAYKNIYAMWPLLAEEAVWDDQNLPDSKLVVDYGPLSIRFRETTRLTNSGGSLNPGTVHPDIHNFAIIPTTGLNFKILTSNDGGVYISNDSSVPGLGDDNWRKVGGSLNTGQFYGADKKRGEDIYVGGMQDNGTYKSFSNPNASSSYTFQFGGDGFEVIWNYGDPDKIIGGAQFNRFRRFDGNTNSSVWSSATNGLEDVGDEKAPFITKLANSPFWPNVIYTVGVSGVWRSNNFGIDWALLPIDTKWVIDSSISSSYDVAVSLSNPAIVWAGGAMTNQRSIFVTQDGGRNFKAVNNYSGTTIGAISGIATHPENDSSAFLLFSQARIPKVLKTKDLGLNWEDLSGFESGGVSNNGFPDVAVHSLLVFPHDTNVIWVGTEIGIFESSDNGISWEILGGDFPAVSVWSMKIVENQVVVGTHGRGIWTATINGLDWPGEIISDINKEIEVDGNNLLLYPNPAFDRVKAKFDLPLTDKIIASMYDINGKMVKQLNFNKTQTHGGEIEIDLGGLNPGLYIIEIDNGQQKVSARLLVKDN